MIGFFFLLLHQSLACSSLQLAWNLLNQKVGRTSPHVLPQRHLEMRNFLGWSVSQRKK